MNTTRGKIHKYFSITINYSLSGKVKLSMADKIGKMIDDMLEDIKG